MRDNPRAVVDPSVRDNLEPVVTSSLRDISEPVVTSSLRDISEPVVTSSLRDSSEPVVMASLGDTTEAVVTGRRWKSNVLRPPAGSVVEVPLVEDVDTAEIRQNLKKYWHAWNTQTWTCRRDVFEPALPEWADFLFRSFKWTDACALVQGLFPKRSSRQ